MEQKKLCSIREFLVFGRLFCEEEDGDDDDIDVLNWVLPSLLPAVIYTDPYLLK